jgi:hypothetical protein
MNKTKYIVLAFTFILLVLFIPELVSASPIIWIQSKTNGYHDFNNNCFDSPTNPNPIQVKNMPINFTNPASQNDIIYVIVHADFNLNGTSTNCINLTLPFITSITDNAGSFYSFVANYQPNQTLMSYTWEIWKATANAGAQQITINMASGKLDVGAVIYDFQNIVNTEIFFGPINGSTVFAGASPFSTTWNFTNQIVLAYGITPNGGACSGNEPNCDYPATSANAGTGGYNETQIGIACPIPPPGGCAANVNSFGKPGGGDNNTIPTATIRISSARITSNTTGSHTWYQQTNSAQATNFWWISFLLSPQEFPIVTTLPATNINVDTALLNGNLLDIGFGPTILVWFMWGDTVSLGNNTTSQSFSSPTTFSQIIIGLFSNHTYYFAAHAENQANPSLFINGAILNFTTPVNQNVVLFTSYGWVFGFIFALILGLMGAYWIKKKREEH